MKITYARSKSPLGIAGQLLNTYDKFKSTFYLLYGDSIFDFDLKPMLKLHRSSGAVLTMGLMQHTQQFPYGIIEVGKDGQVTSWKEKPKVGGLINIGCYVMEPKIFEYIPNRMYPFDDVVRKMISSGEKVSSYVVEGKEFMDIGDEKSYKRVYELFLERMGKVL